MDEQHCKICTDTLEPGIASYYRSRCICHKCYNAARRQRSEESMDESALRRCNHCDVALTVFNVYESRKTICKGCFKADVQRRRLKRADDMEIECIEVEPTPKDDLYVMMNSRIPDEVKVGRSYDPVSRAKNLQQSHNFVMQILRVYPGRGYLEPVLHRRLKLRKVTDEGDGQEWFRIDMPTLDAIVQGTIAESQLQ